MHLEAINLNYNKRKYLDSKYLLIMISSEKWEDKANGLKI